MGRTKGGGKDVEGIIHVAEAKDRRRGEAGGRKLGRGGWDNGMGEVACQVQPEDFDENDEAISRIDNGTYGYCEVTGEPIGLARLEARPVTTLSIEAQELHERSEKLHSND